MNFEPLLDRVLVLQDPGQNRTASGFFIPEVIVEKADRGTVVATGPGKPAPKTGELLPMNVSVDDRVLFSLKDALPVRVDGVDYLVLKQDDIIAIID